MPIVSSMWLGLVVDVFCLFLFVSVCGFVVVFVCVFVSFEDGGLRCKDGSRALFGRVLAKRPSLLKDPRSVQVMAFKKLLQSYTLMYPKEEVR